MSNIKKIFPIILLIPFLFPFNSLASGLNRVGIRPGTYTNEFYDTTTNQPIVFRGNNYIRCQTTPKLWCHSNFYEGLYNYEQTRQALEKMHQDGYNVVRVWFSAGGIIDSTTNKINQEHLNNFKDFLDLATQNKLYVYLILDGLEWKYRVSDPNIDTDHQQQILIKNNIAGKQQYVKDIISGLKAISAPLSTIMGYGVFNEPHFFENEKPFSLSSTFIGPTGSSYNMSSQADKNRLVDDSLAYYMDEVKKAIKEVDPNSLVGITVYTPQAVSGADKRFIVTKKLFNNSSADFVGINIYPRGQSLDTEIASLEIGTSSKPLIMSEFGAYPDIYPTLKSGANAMINFQVETCNKYHFQGWMLYEYDTSEYDHAFRIYHGLEGNGEINHVLSPNYRWDPCLVQPASPPGDLTGDFDNNSHVNILDYNILVADFRKTGLPGWIPTDIDKNGKVDIFDYNTVIANFGK